MIISGISYCTCCAVAVVLGALRVNLLFPPYTTTTTISSSRWVLQLGKDLLGIQGAKRREEVRIGVGALSSPPRHHILTSKKGPSGKGVVL